MSTYLRDYANNVHLALSGNAAAGSTGTTAGSSVDNINDEGLQHAIQKIGTVNGNTPTITGKIQESSDTTTWTDISGAVFTAATTTDDLQVINFLRSQRYTRYYSTIAGTGNLTVPLIGLIGAQKKQI